MRELLKEIIYNVLAETNTEITIEQIAIEIPKDTTYGDYSTNVAMQLARTLKKNPRNIASEIVAKINELNSKHISKVEIAGAGFINFYVTNDYLYDNINKVIELKENYGKINIGNNKKINIEYVSANPTGILHLGHARGASYGDSLARVLKFAGFDVTREYYINDAGNQIGNLENSIKARYEGLCGRLEDMPEGGYHGKEIIAVAKTIKDELGNEVTDSKVFRKKGLDYLLNQIKEDLHNYRANFDLWSSEQSLYDSGLVKETLDKLITEGYTYEQDDAVYLKTTLYGDEKDRVLVKKDKSYTYLVPDIAYHGLKFSRGYDELINVFGADHHGYIPRLKASINMLGYDSDKLDVEILQMVRLVRNGEEVKMSKRTGNAVTIMELVEEVGLDATRYFFSSRSLDTQLDFDLDLACKNTNENPVFYINYAHARIHSILANYKNEIKVLDKYETLTSEYSKKLLSKIYEFSYTVGNSALKKSPHIITNYVYDLATLFHAFYAHEKVLTEDTVSTNERVNLIYATAMTIKNALNLIGVEALEEM